MSFEQQPSRAQLEKICEVAQLLVWHIRLYWSVDGKPLAEPEIYSFATAGGLRHVADMLVAVQAQRKGNHPGPVIEWQLRELVAIWKSLPAGELVFCQNLFRVGLNPPPEVLDEVGIPGFWRDWDAYVPQALRSLVVAAERIVQPLGRGPVPEFFSASEVDALHDASQKLREAILFLPSAMQELILRELDGQAATGEELLARLECGSKETLYGKNGRGGLRELTSLGRVKNERSKGGYYRPDRPPVQKAY